MNIYKIRLNEGWAEEEFNLFTSLTEKQIASVVEPMMSDDEVYEIWDYISNLGRKYPNATIVSDGDFEILTFNNK